MTSKTGQKENAKAIAINVLLISLKYGREASRKFLEIYVKNGIKAALEYFKQLGGYDDKTTTNQQNLGDDKDKY